MASLSEPSSAPPASLSGWQGLARVAAAGVGNYYRDGKFSTATPTGAPVPELPFQQWGDRTTAIWKQRYIQALERWSALPAYSVLPDRPDMYLIKETTPQDLGAGIGTWERWYCQVPIPHTEEEVFPYSFQYIASTSAFGAVAKSVTSRILYEYFLEQDGAAFPILKACKLFALPATVIDARAQGGGVVAIQTGTGKLVPSTPGAFIVSPDAQIVGEDSKLGTWNHPILYRATRYVPGPTVADLGSIWTPGGNVAIPTAVSTTPPATTTTTPGSPVQITPNPGAFTVSPTTIVAGHTQTLTFASDGATLWDDSVTPPGGGTRPTTIYPSAGTIADVQLITDATGTTTAITASYTAPLTGQSVTFRDDFGAASTNALAVTPTAFSLLPGSATVGQTLLMTITGVNTLWTANTAFALTGGTLLDLKIDVATQTATATFTAPASVQAVTLSDGQGGTCTNAINVTAGAFSVSPVTAPAGQSVTITLVGHGTVWTPTTDFTASLGNLTDLVVDVATQVATGTYTPPATAQTITITDGNGVVASNGISVTVP